MRQRRQQRITHRSAWLLLPPVRAVSGKGVRPELERSLFAQSNAGNRELCRASEGKVVDLSHPAKGRQCEAPHAGYDDKRRVCCFDQSGFYSKSFGAPKAAD